MREAGHRLLKAEVVTLPKGGREEGEGKKTTTVQGRSFTTKTLRLGRHGAGPGDPRGLSLGSPVGLDLLYATQPSIVAGGHVHEHSNIEREEGLDQQRRRSFTLRTRAARHIEPARADLAAREMRH